MKKQIQDTIIHNGTKYELQESPLYPYLVKLGYNPFYSPRSNCSRGYVAGWEIRDGKLFLIKFMGFIRRKNKVGITYLFPNKTEVLADWFNETIRIDLGTNFGYQVSSESINEPVFYLDFEKGIQKEILIAKRDCIYLENKSEEKELPF